MPMLLFAASLISSALAAPAAPVDVTIPGGQESYYTTRLTRALQPWPPKFVDKEAFARAPAGDACPLWIRMVKTAGRDNYVGQVKVIHFGHPMEKVAAQIEAFEKYPEFFDEVEAVKVTERRKLTSAVGVAGAPELFVTEWERESPVFFYPNIRYTQSYVWDRSQPGRISIRYQLVSGKNVRNADGLIVIEKTGSSTSRIVALDFFDPIVPLRALAEGKIWGDAVEGAYKGDYAFRARLDHPEWSKKEIRKSVEREMERCPVNEKLIIDQFSLGD